MNPHHRNRDRVCTTIKLKRLRECRSLKVEEFLDAFSETFGFSEDCLNTGLYKGTLFWFPLREAASELSDTCYDGSKVLDLFKSFRSEAVHSLLFLKSLRKAELFCRGSGSDYDLGTGEAFFTVQLGAEDDANEIVSNLVEERSQFIDRVKAACDQTPTADIVTVTRPKFKTRYKTIDSTCAEEQSSIWIVVNVFKGGTMSNKLRQLVNDKDLSYMPYVGAAVPYMRNGEPLKGHLFCFLPLPQERKSLTGLPVHFNGFFALSANRRHLKWASDDQETLNMHRDKSIEWNECLVKEVLPGVYLRLIKEMIKISEENGNTQDAVAAVYKCIPDKSVVDSKWEECMKEILNQLVRTDFVFVPKQSKWVQPNRPLYTMFDGQNVPEDQKKTVIKILSLHGTTENTDVPKHIWHILTEQANPRDVSPAELVKVIRSDDAYAGTNDTNEKLNLLQYITKDDNFALLDGIELLPLQTGTFTTFRSSKNSPVYCCTKEEIALFPGLEDKFASHDIPLGLQESLCKLGREGEYN